MTFLLQSVFSGKRRLLPVFLVIVCFVLGQYVGRSKLLANESAMSYFAQQLAYYPSIGGLQIATMPDAMYAGFANTLFAFSSDDHAEQLVPAGSVTMRNHITGLAVDDQMAYVASIDGLSVVDVSDQKRPFKLGETEGPWLGTVVADGKIVYAQDILPSGVYVFDAADPHNPVQVRYLSAGFTHSTSMIGAHNQLLFLRRLERDADNNTRQFIQAVSFANLEQPETVGEYTLPEHTTAVSAQIANGYLYLLTYTDCRFSDCVSKQHLRILTLDTLTVIDVDEMPHHGSMRIANDHIYILQRNHDTPSYFHVWEMLSPLAVEWVGEREIEESIGYSFEVDQNYAYLFENGIQRLDIRDPENLEFLGDYRLFHYKQILIDEQRSLLLGLDSRRLEIVDISNLAFPHVLFTHAWSYDSSRRVSYLGFELVDEVLYILWADEHVDNFMLESLDVSDPSAPTQLARYKLPLSPTAHSYRDARLQAIGNRLHIGIEAWDEGGVYTIIDITDPALPHQLDSWQGGEFWGEFVVQEENVFVVVEDVGLELLDISEPAQIKHLGTQLRGRDFISDVVAWQEYVYLLEDAGEQGYELVIFDASNLSNLVEVAAHPLDREPESLWLADGSLYINYDSSDIQGRIEQFNLTNPLEPRRTASIIWGNDIPLRDLERVGNLLYMSTRAFVGVWRLHPRAAEQHLPVLPHHWAAGT